jgi:hypothetical protein
VASGPIIAPLPEIDLGPGCQVVLEAIDPSTGATVAGVVITDATIYAEDVSGLGFDILPGPPLLSFQPGG